MPDNLTNPEIFEEMPPVEHLFQWLCQPQVIQVVRIVAVVFAVIVCVVFLYYLIKSRKKKDA